MRRREETGWTDFRIERFVTQHYDRTPEGDAVRGHLYAGGGASLFRTALLRRYAARTLAYAPFYFEDARPTPLFAVRAASPRQPAAGLRGFLAQLLRHGPRPISCW